VKKSLPTPAEAGATKKTKVAQAFSLCRFLIVFQPFRDAAVDHSALRGCVFIV
jgi:hypothetical protein